MRAVGWRPEAAAIVGVNIRWILAATAFVAALIAGLAGILTGMNQSNVSFALGENLLFKGFAAVVIGGFSDVRGMAIGGLLIGLVEVFSSQYISSILRDAITFGLAFLLLMIWPTGIWKAKGSGG
jgi:branched-chain amino acid transport system permease protein